MATIADAQQAVSDIRSSLTTLDEKLDEVRTRIDNLEVNQPVTQGQLDALVESLNQAKAAAAAVLSEADTLDGTIEEVEGGEDDESA